MSLVDLHNKVGEEVFPDYLLQSAQQSTEENKALFEAALHGRADELRSILKFHKDSGKVNPNYFHRPEDQKNALHVAAEFGHLDCLKILLEHGAVVDAVAVSKQDTALILASCSNRPNVVKLLLDHNANVHAVNCYGNSSLHEASHSCHLAVGALLIAAGAHVAAANKKGSTPLHILGYCSEPGLQYAEFVDLLVKSAETERDAHGEILGVKKYLELKDKRGATPLLVCCASGRLHPFLRIFYSLRLMKDSLRVEIIKRLLHYGADIHAKDEAGQDAKAVAVFYGQTAVVEYLDSLSKAKK